MGCEQIGDWPAGESASYALAEAERRGDRMSLKKLSTIGSPPHDAKRLLTERTLVQRLDVDLDAKLLWNMGRVFLSRPEASLFDLANLMRGFGSLWTP